VHLSPAGAIGAGRVRVADPVTAESQRGLIVATECVQGEGGGVLCGVHFMVLCRIERGGLIVPFNPQNGLGAVVGGSIPIQRALSLVPPVVVNALAIEGDIVRHVTIRPVRPLDCSQVPSLGADCSLECPMAGDNAIAKRVFEDVHSGVELSAGDYSSQADLS
jgi:hypothetical protein